jgi:uncharacterized protein (DUF488 family)
MKRTGAPGPAARAPRRATEVTVLAQASVQRAWNAERLTRLLARRGRAFDFLTAGSSGRSPSDLMALAELAPFRSRLLVDIRANPQSLHTPEWNDRRLAATLARKGWEYLPRPDLGVPAELRQRLHRGEIGYDRFFAWYDRHVATREALRTLEELLPRRPILLCTELGPIFCHRHRLARALEAAYGGTSWDL